MKNCLPLFFLLMIISCPALAQSFTVSGKVADSTGRSLSGVNIRSAGTGNTATSNSGGFFHIDLKSSSDSIFVSHVGYVPITMAVNGQNNITITLQENNTGLGEVVIVGYGTQRRASVTGAVATVSAADLTRAPVADVTNSLAGRLPGLVVTQQSGEPGFNSSSLSIRGFGNALIIVDGVETPLNNIDPNEVASITILKDASAAIYGSRAGNGVILVTSKRGAGGKPTIRANSTFSWQTLTVFPKPLDAGRYAELIRESEINSGVPEVGRRFTAEQVEKYKQGTEPGYQGTNWWDVIMNNYSPLQQHNISVSGGNDAIKYYTFIGYTSQTGMYKSGDNKFKRYNIRTNVDGKIRPNLTVSMDVAANAGSVNSPTRAQTNLWQDFYELYPTLPASLPDPARIAYGGTLTSTIASVTRDLGGYNDQNNSQLSATLSARYDIPGVKGLYLKGLVNYLQNNTETKVWTKAYTMWTYEPTNDTYTPFISAPVTGLNESYYKARTVTAQASLNYGRTFGDHSISGLLLTEVVDYADHWLSAGRTGFITTSIDYLFAGGNDNQQANGSASESGRVGYVGRLNYAFKDKYLLEATLRYDGSPKFPAGKRWGLFPSVSAGWRITEEPFFKDHAQWLSNLKLRASVSNTGYDGIGAFQYLTGYQFGSAYIVDQQIRTGLISTGLANPDITWEEMTIYNIGVDYALHNNKIYGELDVFYRDRRNMLANRLSSLPNTFGATLPLENINSMNNRGLELKLGYRNKIGEVSFDISGNFSYTRAKWDHFEEPDYTDPDDIKINKVSGNWANRLFGYQSDGLFTSAEEIQGYKLDQDGQANQTLLPGDIKYIDQNGDNKLDWRDKVEIGKTNDPEMMFGLNLNVNYKNFDFSVLFQGAAGRNFLEYLAVENFANQKDVLYDNRWTEENNNKWASVPRQYMGGKVNNSYTSDYWLKDASYLRLKTLSLGYNLPSHLLNRAGISSVRIYFAGTNLITFSGMNKYNVDPEAPTGIKTGNYYPQQKVYTLGVNLSF